MKEIKGILENEKSYEMWNYDIYTKGDLKGYLNGYIEVDNNRQYELLYRISDKENGNDNTIVSIDYGWKEFSEVDFNNIEDQITKVLNIIQ